MMGGNAYAPIQHRSADEDAAGIVRQIFEWAADGNTAAEITGKLYAMNTPTPGEYRRDKWKDHYNVSRTHGIWSRRSLKLIFTIMFLSCFCHIPTTCLKAFGETPESLDFTE